MPSCRWSLDQNLGLWRVFGCLDTTIFYLYAWIEMIPYQENRSDLFVCDNWIFNSDSLTTKSGAGFKDYLEHLILG